MIGSYSMGFAVDHAEAGCKLDVRIELRTSTASYRTDCWDASRARSI